MRGETGIDAPAARARTGRCPAPIRGPGAPFRCRPPGFTQAGLAVVDSGPPSPIKTGPSMAYDKIQPPADGAKIQVNADFSLNVPDNPIIPYIEGDGIGIDISPVMIDVVDAAVAKAYGGKRKIRWMEIYAGREVHPPLWRGRLATGGDPGRGQGLRGLHQGAPDHPGGRRYPLAQRHPAPGTRPLRLPAPGALLHWDPEPAQGARAHGHGDLPRERRGHLRRHRVAGALAPRRRRSSPSCSRRWGSPRSASPRPPASASSRSPRRGPSAWCARRSSTPSTTTAPR